MNNTQIVYKKFNEAINWNALLYTVYKSINTLQTFILYKYLTSYDFSTWAIINSIIYLLLLWADCGFRKSIPRFYHLIFKNNKFIKYLIIFQSCLLITISPICVYMILQNPIWQKNSYYTIFWLIPLLFFSEGIIALLRLIFHATFKNKIFNTLYIFSLAMQVGINITFILKSKTNLDILKTIFITKIGGGFFIIISTCMILFFQLKNNENKNRESIPSKDFIQHSALMWSMTGLKSISERNFLIPLLGYIAGPTIVSIFKVANDGALFFQRIILMTIGSNDTALFSHIQMYTNDTIAWQVAFTKLTTKIVGLCLPVLGIIVFAFLVGYRYISDIFVFQLFLIMISFYLIELLILPYERVLEVKKDYKYLVFSYLPYLIIFLCLLFKSYHSWIGLLPFLLIVHGVRLVSLGIVLYYVRSTYSLVYPYKYTFFLFGVYISVGVTSYALCILLPFDFLLSLPSFLSSIVL